MTTESEFAALLREAETDAEPGSRPNRRRRGSNDGIGARLRGQVIAIDAQHILVDVGAKTEAIMDAASFLDAEGAPTLALGDTVEGVVTGIDPDTGALLFGPRQAKSAHNQAELEAAFRQGLPVEGQIVGLVKGGLEVRIAGARAFCPASQVDLRFIEDLAPLVGERHAFRITKLEGGRTLNLVVSRRALLEEEQAARATETRAKLVPGAVLTGRVTALREFGVFVDLGGVEGLIHISELSLDRVRDPGEVLSLGQEVETVVLRIEPSDNPKRPERIALSIRALAPDPWRTAAEDFPVGTEVNGTVTSLQPFGAFVAIASGLDGLLHIGELGAGRRIAHPREAVSVGDSVAVRVQGVDVERRRIALTLVAGGAQAALPKAMTAPAVATKASQQDAPRIGTLGELLRERLNERTAD